MPLSEHEQRILDEIERRLAAEDPKFARATTAATPRGIAVRRFKRAIAGFCFGLGLLVAGLLVPSLLLAFGLASFAVMLMSLFVGARAAKGMGRVVVPSRNRTKQPGLFDRLEERWKRRFENGDGR